jgi:transposase
MAEGAAGMAQLHGLVGGFLGEDAGGAEVVVGIENGRGPWVAALAAAGYLVFAVNPLQAARFRERHGVSGAKSDAGDAHALADMVRTDSHQLRPAAGDSPEAEGIKVLARTHKTMIWERTREVQRLRHLLREYFPAALEAFDDLDAPDTLELLAKAPEPARREADPRAGQRRPQARRPPEHHGAGHRRPGRAARRAARPAAGAHCRLRRCGAGADRGDHCPERAGQGPRTAGEGPFWAAPGR